LKEEDAHSAVEVQDIERRVSQEEKRRSWRGE
jgi:hypothetical protein